MPIAKVSDITWLGKNETHYIYILYIYFALKIAMRENWLGKSETHYIYIINTTYKALYTVLLT